MGLRHDGTSSRRSARPPTGSAIPPPSPAGATSIPAVLEAYLEGSLGGALVEVAEEQDRPPHEADPDEEAAVVRLLRQRRRQDRAKRRKA